MGSIRHTTAVVIPAGGSGSRLGAGTAKAFVDIDGTPMFIHAVRAFADCAAIVVAAPVTDVPTARSLLSGHGLDDVRVVTGGSSRSESIEQALHEVPADVPYVLVHDAARPLVPAAVVDRVLQALERGADAVVPVLPVTDSLKRVAGDVVAEHVNRAEFSRAQTPQGFRAPVLREAYAAAQRTGALASATDDASIVAHLGVAVATVAGDESNIKVTTANDLLIVRGTWPAEQLRSATATDVHAFSEEGTLALAGLNWPEAPALAGHSDGDAALHALCDAFLSAAGLGDLGQQFGVDEPQWAGASGITLLEHTMKLLRTGGWRAVSAQVQIIGNRPRFAPRRAEAEQLVSGIVGIRVHFGATTTDGLGFLGRGEGVAATANVLVNRSHTEQVNT